MKKLVEVCDICGEIATKQVTIDACQDHSSLGSNHKGASRARKPGKKSPCPVCGRAIGVQGMQNHMRKHESSPPDGGIEKTAEQPTV